VRQGHGSFPTAGAWVEAGGDEERDAADAGAVRGVGGRAALRRGGRLLVLLPRLLVALLVDIRLLDDGEYETALVHFNLRTRCSLLIYVFLSKHFNSLSKRKFATDLT
jgi:hypothetical protein